MVTENENPFRTARPGESSPAEQEQASRTLKAMEDFLEGEIAKLPVDKQGAVREVMRREMGAAQRDIASGGVNLLALANRRADDVKREVGAVMLQAQAGTALRAAVFLDDADTILSEQERRALRNDIAAWIADDEVFSKFSPYAQQRLAESTSRFIESDPELAGQVQFQQQNPEETRVARDESRRGRREFSRLVDSPEMAAYHDRLEAVEGKLFGRMSPRMQGLMRDRDEGKISDEDFVRGMEREAERDTQMRGRMMRGAVRQMNREDPAMGAAFERYLKENNLTSVDQYRPMNDADQRAAQAAFRTLEANGGDFSKLGPDEQELIARARVDAAMRGGNDTRNVTEGIVALKAQGLQSELAGKTPEQRVEYMIDHGLIDARARSEALALFQSFEGKDDQLFNADRRELSHMARSVTRSMDYAKTSLNDAVARDKFNSEIGDLTDSLTEKGWAKYRSADGSRTFDLDGDSKIELDEIKKVLKANGITKLDQIDSDKDGELSRDELVRALTPIVEKTGAKIR